MNLGRFEINNVYCEDSYKAIKDIPDKSVDCIYTDIPYDMTFSGGGTLKHKLGNYIKDEVKTFSSGIDYSIINEFIRIMKNINCFIWCSKNQIYDILKMFEPYKTEFNILTWTKTNPIPFGSSIWLSDIEYYLHFYKGSGYNIGWEYKKKNYSSPINSKDKDNFAHPTIKPLEMVKNHLLNLTQPNDIVADFFLGSGTTCVACKDIGRNYIGFEINPKWHKIAVDRLNNVDANGQTSMFLK